MRIVSKKLRDSARGQDCTVRIPGVCNFNPETTVLAHLPCGSKGAGMKGPDIISVFCCSSCHDAIDGRRNDIEIDWKDIIRAIAETQLIWISKGLLKITDIRI